MKWISKTGQESCKTILKKRGLHPLIHPVILTLLLFTFLPGLATFGNKTKAFADLYINEFMADNDSSFEDPHDPNSFDDWIEIYNSGSSIVNMAGMYLTDNLDNPTKWPVPSGISIPAGGHLIFLADDDEEQGNTHTNFKLGAEGEEIGLFATNGTLVDSVTFGTQLLDVSYGRYPDGADNWGFMAGTPGAANSSHNAPPTITGTAHSPVSPAGGEVVWVTCRVTDDSAVASVTLTYISGSNPAESISMFDDGVNHDGGIGDGLFGAQVPESVKDTIVDYYVTATDLTGAGSTDPVKAPSVTHYYIVGYEAPLLYINEFMADNESANEDPDDPNNSFDDWIEIYNPNGYAVNMAGMYLTDDLDNPKQWRVPTGVSSIPAGEYLIFWTDNDDGQGLTHTSFRLAAEGEEIALFGADGVTLVDSLTFGPQLPDVSYGRYPDGAGKWGFMTGTQEAANGPNNAPPVISGTAHAPESPAGGEVVWVTCTVIDDGAVDSVALTYIAASSQSVNIPMLDDGLNHDGGSGDGLFGAQIPASVKDTIVDYYVTVTDDDIGLEFTDPVTAPALTYCYIVGYEPPPLFINEFMADNGSMIKDPDDPNDRFEDWIEIYNSSASPLNMGGMYLTDDLGNPTRWQIPVGVSIPPGGYLVFWADNDEEQGNTHTGFKLNKENGEIGLFDTDAKRNMSIDTMTYGGQPTDFSSARIKNGEEPWILSADATPGYANAFPLGTHTMVWTLSLSTDSHSLIEEMAGCVIAIERVNLLSDKWESAYLFWGKPSGHNFPVEPGQSYIISLTSPCSFTF
ncbi:MAG: lamin tail domain-containing protein [bacterium]